MKKCETVKDVAVRTVGLAMVSSSAGAGVGAIFAHNWITGSVVAFFATASIVWTYLGVVLMWNGKATSNDIQEAYRTAAAKAGDDNEDIKAVIEHKIEETK